MFRAGKTHVQNDEGILMCEVITNSIDFCWNAARIIVLGFDCTIPTEVFSINLVVN